MIHHNNKLNRIYNFIILYFICAFNSYAQISEENINNGLMCYFPFNGSAQDSSGKNNHGKVHGASLTEDRFGLPSNAYFFDGQSNYIEIPDNDTLEIIGDFSISVWIKSNDQSHLGVVLSKHISGPARDGTWAIFHQSPNGIIVLGASPRFDERISTGGSVPAKEWHHIVFTYKQESEQWKVYVDGLLSNSGRRMLEINNNTRPLLIGTEDHPSGKHFFFHGALDELRIYNRTISDKEVSILKTDKGISTELPNISPSLKTIIDKTIAVPGETVALNLVVQNIDKQDSAETDLIFYVIKPNDEDILSQQSTTLLPIRKNGEAEYSFKFKFPENAPEGNYKFRATWNTLNQMPESNYLDNYLERNLSIKKVGKLFVICLGMIESRTIAGIEYYLRGDLGAKAVYNRLKQDPKFATMAEGNTTSEVAFEVSSNLAPIIQFHLQKMKVNPGDTLVFYYNGHAGPLSDVGTDEGESPVATRYGEAEDKVYINDMRDEFLGNDVRDDALAAGFATEKWHGVKKVFWLDCCHAGGFFGTGKDDKDLAALQDVALLGAVVEEGQTGFMPNSAGLWTTEALLRALDLGGSLNEIAQHTKNFIKNSLLLSEPVFYLDEMNDLVKIRTPETFLIGSENYNFEEAITGIDTRYLRIKKLSEKLVQVKWPANLPCMVEWTPDLIFPNWEKLTGIINDENELYFEIDSKKTPRAFFRFTAR